MSRLRTTAVLTLALIGLNQPGPAAEPASIVLGGLRQVRASIRTAGDGYRIEIRMLPVTSFDTVTNTRLSREKARAYALQALARHLGGGADARWLVSGARVTQAGPGGQEFRLTLTVPRGGVVADRGPAPVERPEAMAEAVRFSDAFFTAKHDYLHTLERLAAGWDAARRTALRDSDAEFELTIARVEEEGVDQLRRLREEVAGHKMLLFTERDDLLRAIEDRKAALLEALKETVRQRRVIAQFADIKLASPFDGYLLSQPLLMEVTGAKVIRLTNGRTAVVGIASTVLRDGSADDRVRAERVCIIKARAAVIGEQQGVQVAHVEQIKDRTVVVVVNGKETAKSVSELLVLTRSKVEGISRGLAPVGRWKSADGKVFYLAVGGIFDAQGNTVSATLP